MGFPSIPKWGGQNLKQYFMKLIRALIPFYCPDLTLSSVNRQNQMWMLTPKDKQKRLPAALQLYNHSTHGPVSASPKINARLKPGKRVRAEKLSKLATLTHACTRIAYLFSRVRSMTEMASTFLRSRELLSFFCSTSAAT